MKYRVQAYREGGWWALEFPDIDERVHSQVRRLDQAKEVAAEAITFSLADEPNARVVSAAEVEVVPMLDELVAKHLVRALEARAHLVAAAADAGAATWQAVERCTEAGLSMRDVGTLLGVSHQYVAKVAKQHELV